MNLAAVRAAYEADLEYILIRPNLGTGTKLGIKENY